MDQPTRSTTLVYIRRALCLIALAALLISINWLLPTLLPASGADAKAVLFVGDGEKVLRYDAASGALIDVFIQPGDQVTLRQADLLIGPNDNLYVISGLEVLRYNAVTGASQGVLVDLSQHGFVVAFRIALGADGYIYVGGQKSGLETASKVARFDSTTGAFIDDFIPRLDSPEPYIQRILVGPDGNLYIGVIDGVLRYDGTTGALIDRFIPNQGQPALFVTGMCFGPDGDLYITDGTAVLRFDGTTGASKGVFTHGGDLESAYEPAFGPDGNLYVIAQNDDRVLRYDGTTGTFIDLFIPPGSAANIIGASFLRFWPVSVTPPRS